MYDAAIKTRLSTKAVRALKKEAKRQNVSPAQIVRIAITSYLLSLETNREVGK